MADWICTFICSRSDLIHHQQLIGLSVLKEVSEWFSFGPIACSSFKINLYKVKKVVSSYFLFSLTTKPSPGLEITNSTEGQNMSCALHLQTSPCPPPHWQQQLALFVSAIGGDRPLGADCWLVSLFFCCKKNQIQLQFVICLFLKPSFPHISIACLRACTRSTIHH